MDMPCSELNTQVFVDEAHKVVAALNAVEGHLATVGVKGNGNNLL
jgi:hypothetical protein